MTGKVAARMVADPQFERLVERLYRRGPRLVAEVLAELGARHDVRDDIETVISRYLDIPDEALDAIGGREMPPLPIHGVSR